jgi:hypothetical protein
MVMSSETELKEIRSVLVEEPTNDDLAAIKKYEAAKKHNKLATYSLSVLL